MAVDEVFLLNSPVQVTVSGGLIPSGAYNALTAYVVGDSVSYNGSSYVALTSTTGNLPTNTTYWQLLASIGNTGATGSTGSTGSTGATGAAIGGILTTLGDMVYEDATPTAVRLAGNTTTAKQFLTQTGTGTISAAPAWGTIANTDVSGLGSLSTLNSIDLTANVGTSVLPIANGGTGSATQNFVDLSSAQTIGGSKTFTNTLNVHTITPVINNNNNLGSTSLYFLNLYAGTWNANSTASLTGASAGTINVNAGSLGILATSNAATHSLTLGSTATGIALYNTSDQTTNYERLLLNWNSNLFQIQTGAGGTGVKRDLKILGSNGIALAFKANNNNIQVLGTTTSNHQLDFEFSTLAGSSGLATGINLAPTINQSSTAGYTALLVNPTETSTGSGTKLLIDAHVGAAAGFKVDNGGYATFQGAFSNGDITAHNIILASNNTYSIGSPSAYAQYIYATRTYLNSTAYLDGGTAGTIAVGGYLNNPTINDHASWVSGATAKIFLGDTGTYFQNIWGGSTGFVSNNAFDFNSSGGGDVTFTNSSTVKLRIGSNAVNIYEILKTSASTTSAASLNIPSGTAPTSPLNGDIWFDGTNLKIQIGGVTKTFTVS